MDEKDVADLLGKALRAVEQAQVPEDLREVAFTAALGMLGGAGMASATQPSPPPTGATMGASQQPQPPATGGSGSETLDRIAREVRVDASTLRHVYAEQDGEPRLIVKSANLPKTDAAGSRDIALLTMAGRQGAAIEEYTAAEVLRDVCKRYGRYDQGNFGKHMKSLDNYIITQGKGVSMKRKLTHPGMEAAGELINRLTTSEGS